MGDIGSSAAGILSPPGSSTASGGYTRAEDERNLRELIGRGLRANGFTVIEAANGIDALELALKPSAHIDLLITDVVMPEMDGLTLFIALRDRGVDIKTIFISGYAEDAFEKNLPSKEQFAFLPKPFTTNQLVSAVNEVLLD